MPDVLGEAYCQQLIDNYDAPAGYRKIVAMERHRFGLGEYKYYDYPLPELIRVLREHIYPHLVPVANHWMDLLKIDNRFPATFEGLQAKCRAHQQVKSTPLILRYEQGGFNTLHQDLYGDVYFPLQVAVFLNKPGSDYSGGEFVMTQQTPRAQAKVMVLSPQQGSMVIFTTRFRPVKGVRGYYRAAVRHGVSVVLSGNRHTLGILFHDAVS